MRREPGQSRGTGSRPRSIARCAGLQVLAVPRASGDHEDRRPGSVLENQRRVLRRAPAAARPSRQSRGRRRLQQIRGGEPTPRASETAASAVTAARESPPSPKKSSSTPTWLRSSASRNALATASSIGSRGARKGVASEGDGRRRGQRGAIDLSRRRARQRVQEDEGGRPHRSRQPLLERPAQAESVGGFSRRRTTHAARARSPRRLEPARGRLAHPRDVEQRGLHLGGLDAVAAHLQARVPAARVKEAAVRQQAPEIAGPVEAPPRAAGDRPEKRRGRRVGILPVAQRERAGAHGRSRPRPRSRGPPRRATRPRSRPPRTRAASRRARAIVPGRASADHVHLGRPNPRWKAQERGKRLRYKSKSEAKMGSPPSRTMRKLESSSLPSSVAEKLRKTLGTE